MNKILRKKSPSLKASLFEDALFYERAALFQSRSFIIFYLLFPLSSLFQNRTYPF